MGDKLIKQTIDTTKLGMISNVGLFSVGTLGGLSPSNNVTKQTSAGLNLINVGNTAKIGLDMIKKFK